MKKFIISSLLLFSLSFFLYHLFKKKNKRTTGEVIESIRTNVHPFLEEEFKKRSLSFPPNQLAFLALKEEMKLEVYAKENDKWQLVLMFPIQAASGKSGPKLKEGDRQVPEGFYKLISFNPNSSFHLSLELNYPNPEDKEIAEQEKRTNLGGEIFIHGKSASIGCLAMGDESIERIFYLAHLVGLKNIEFLITPHDFRSKPYPKTDNQWLNERYIRLSEYMKSLNQ